MVNVSTPQTLDKHKTALLSPATATDRYRLNSEWCAVQVWNSGQSVEAVRQFNHHEFVTGEHITVNGKRRRIESITMLDTADITDEQARSLGYGSIDAFRREWGEGSHAWLIRVHPARRWFGIL